MFLHRAFDYLISIAYVVEEAKKKKKEEEKRQAATKEEGEGQKKTISRTLVR